MGEVRGTHHDGTAITTPPVHIGGKDSSGNVQSLAVNSSGNISIINSGNSLWTPSQQSDVTVDSSTKVFTVPASTEWHIYSIFVAYTTNATVGNRQVAVDIRDGSDNVINRVVVSSIQTASLTRNYSISPGMMDLPGFRNTTYLSSPLPPTIVIPATFDVRIYDIAAVDPSGVAENLLVRMLVGARSV